MKGRGSIRTAVAWVAMGWIALSGAGLHSSAETAAQKHKKKAHATTHKEHPPAKHTKKAETASSRSTHARKRSVRERDAAHRSKKETAHRSALSIRLKSEFVASAQLRPMAQQLVSNRSSAAYAGVLAYAQSHSKDTAATAYLALGHAYALDHRFDDALQAYKKAGEAGTALDDYADYLGAQAALQAAKGDEAYKLLDRFAERHPGSIFSANAPVLLANAYLQQGDPQGALRVLQPMLSGPLASHADFQYAMGRAYQLSGDNAHASSIFRNIYLTLPLSFEAKQAETQLDALGVQLTAAERKSHADQLFDAKHYAEASAEYHAIAKDDKTLSASNRDALAIYVALCDLKLRRLDRREVEDLPETSDDSAALKLYLRSELARNEDNRSQHDEYVAELVKRFPKSRWLEEALYSGGNMYLIKRDFSKAIEDYLQLVRLFPNSTYAPSAHWRAAWLNYRLRQYTEAGRLMDEQIERYTAGIEVPSALYWRGRIYEDEEHNFGQAANYYHAVVTTYPNYYYAMLARQRLTVLSASSTVKPALVLASVHEPAIPDLNADLPEDDEHLIKARLLANAALNEYIAPEIRAGEDSKQWGALAMAELFASFGEYARSLQAMKHSNISFFTLPVDQVPMVYWHLLFPQAYWPSLVASAQENDLDPYLVASLIRQESEFNPGAVSRANAYGLMQLLPSVGKSMAKKQHMKGFNTSRLLDPGTNLKLGTMNLKLVLDRFGGQKEYALAAYNAGDTPVRQWMASGDYKDIPEFVESIPYTETREYVQAILRNREMYRLLYANSKNGN